MSAIPTLRDISYLSKAHQIIKEGAGDPQQVVSRLPEALRIRVLANITTGSATSLTVENLRVSIGSVAYGIYDGMTDMLKSKVDGIFYRFCGVSKTGDRQWGKHNIHDSDKIEQLLESLREVSSNPSPGENSVRFLIRSVISDAISRDVDVSDLSDDIDPADTGALFDKLQVGDAFRSEVVNFFVTDIQANEQALLKLLYHCIGSYDFETPYQNTAATALLSILNTSSVRVITAAIEKLQAALLEIEQREWGTFPSLKEHPDCRFFSSLIISKVHVTLDELVTNFEEFIAEIESAEPRLQSMQEGESNEWASRRGSWEHFKARIRDFPVAKLFDNQNDENRKKQYYSLGCRFLQCVKASLAKEDLGYILDRIEIVPHQSFLDTCRTGWSERISQFESIFLVSGDRELTMEAAILRPLEVSRDVRRDIVNECIMNHMTAFNNQNVHTLENLRFQMNSKFDLGYTADELGAGVDVQGYSDVGQEISNQVASRIESSLISDVYSRLIEEWNAMTEENRLQVLDVCLDRYFEILIENTDETASNSEAAKARVDKLREMLLKYNNSAVALWMLITKIGTLNETSGSESRDILHKLSSQPILDSKIIRLLLADNMKISQEIRGRALVFAAARGHINIVEFLLANNMEISTAIRAGAVFFAALRGHINIVDFLLADNMEISKQIRGLAVARAVQRGSIEIIKLLLAGDKKISRGARALAAIDAALSGHIEIVELLLSDNTESSQEARGLAVAYAAERGSIEIIKLLLAGDKEISTSARARAVFKAAWSANIEIVELLLSDNTESSQEARSEAVVIAAQRGDIEIIKLLLAGDKEIPTAARGEAVVKAAGSGNIEIVRFLLANNKKISHEDRREAVNRATERGHDDIIELLLERTEILQ